MRMHFLNKLPEYMLVIQLVQDRGSQLHFGLSSLYHSCEIQLWVLVVFLHHSELHRVAFQDDWIASRMKNSAKMHLHLFTQTSESSRIYTQYRCHFRRVISNVVGYRFCVLKWLSCHLGRGARRRCSDAPILLSGCWHGLRTEGETRRRLSPGSRKAFLFQSAAAA